MVEKNLTRFGVDYEEVAVNQPLPQGDGDTIFNDIQLLDTSNELKLTVTSQQYMLLLSAAINGANRFFPDNWIEVLYPLIKAGKEYAMDCQSVADCIETSTEVTNALTYNNDQYATTDPNYLSEAGTESTTIINNRFPPAEREQEIFDAPPGCDKDKLWAAIRYIVERIDDNGRQMLERIVTKVDIWEKVIEFVGTVPIVGELAENVLKAFVGSVQDLLNAYDAHSSQTAMDEIACDLFEMVCAECRYPTFNEIADYYANFGITGVQDWVNLSLKAIVDYVTGSNGLAGLVVYFTVNTFQLWVLYAEATFVNASKAKVLRIWADIGEDYANNGWELLCNACADTSWAYELDLTQALPAWVTVANGNWVNGVGVTAVDVGSPAQSTVNILITLNEVYSMLRFSLQYERSSDGSFNDDTRIIGYTAYPSSTGRENWFEEDEAAHGYQLVTECNPAPGIPSGAKPQWLFSVRDNNAGAAIVMKKIRFWNENYILPPSPLPDNSVADCHV